jgi:hypothetical protein
MPLDGHHCAYGRAHALKSDSALRRDALKCIGHLLQRRTRVDFSRRTRTEQGLNLRSVVKNPIPLSLTLAKRVLLSTGHALENHVRRSSQQDNRIEARVELCLVRNTSGDEQHSLARFVKQRFDSILPP